MQLLRCEARRVQNSDMEGRGSASVTILLLMNPNNYHLVTKVGNHYIYLHVTLNLTSLETRADVVTLFQARQVNTWVRWLWAARTLSTDTVLPLPCLNMKYSIVNRGYLCVLSMLRFYIQ